MRSRKAPIGIMTNRTTFSRIDSMRRHDVVITEVLAANHDEIEDPKITTTPIRSTATRATRRPYSVTAIPCSARRNRTTARIDAPERDARL
jgi:hypothetical protein